MKRILVMPMLSVCASASLTFASTDPANSCLAVHSKDTKKLSVNLSGSFLEGPMALPKERLQRGLSATLIHQLDVDSEKLFYGCKITYDLWDERYLIAAIASSASPALLVFNADNRSKINFQDKFVRVVSSLSQWPPECSIFSFQGVKQLPTKVLVTSELNPSSPEQIARTKKWLASKGVGSGTGAAAFVGRAAVAIVRLNAQASTERICSVEAK